MIIVFTALNVSILKNPNVQINPQKGGSIIVTPLRPQAESKNIEIIREKWEGANLINRFKEVEGSA